MFLDTLLHMTFTLSLSAHAQPVDSCSSLIGTCEYYSCVESERLSCGATGYPIGYGVNYCEKLSALEFHPARTALGALTFPGDGNLWRDEVRTCLQEEMDDYFATTKEASCEGLREFAFYSHPKCYTQATSFCELTVDSILKVGFTISPKDLLTSESLSQVATTAMICKQQISGRLQTEENPLVRLNLLKYQLVWSSIARDPKTVSDHMRSLKP